MNNKAKPLKHFIISPIYSAHRHKLNFGVGWGSKKSFARKTFGAKRVAHPPHEKVQFVTALNVGWVTCFCCPPFKLKK
ncbi:MAG: hypothetical protein DRR16_22185 [Candidatus Parabeggiatoa sp. nov. 3]|nr:MAG: hypothetical protein DRR00_26285 [Gammaproteobacteria bacterium]RKZ56734.1 MAG: hypothetical protein DRQ99_28050 [Gammaproteobacteria bacterium]RKZ81405.1 MAG: hypothetical protein DRR16_22185 [Gammaproteobacteria bacterium]